MLSQFPRNTRHVLWSPCEDVPILTEDLDERAFLFAVESHADGDDAVRMVLVQPDLLGVLVRLKGRLGCGPLSFLQVLLGEVNFALDFFELVRDDERLSQLGTGSRALDGTLVIARDCDDSFWARHLHLQVRVMRHRHEFGQSRSSEEGVVGAAQVDNLEPDRLAEEVALRGE